MDDPKATEGVPAETKYLPLSSPMLLQIEAGEAVALMGMLLEARKTTEVLEMVFPSANTEPRRITIERLIGKLRRALDEAAKPRTG